MTLHGIVHLSCEVYGPSAFLVVFSHAPQSVGPQDIAMFDDVLASEIFVHGGVGGAGTHEINVTTTIGAVTGTNAITIAIGSFLFQTGRTHERDDGT